MSILVVLERDALLRRSLRILLEMKERQVVEVATSDGALRVMRDVADPCVLVLQHRLPGADALLVLSRVANDPDLVARHRVVVIPSLASPLAQPLPVAVRKVDVRIVPVPYDLQTLQAVIKNAARGDRVTGATRDTAGAADATPTSPWRPLAMDGHAPPPDPISEREPIGDGDDAWPA